MLASHFHDQIARQAMTSPMLILFGVVILAVALDVSRRMPRRLLIELEMLAFRTQSTWPPPSPECMTPNPNRH